MGMAGPKAKEKLNFQNEPAQSIKNMIGWAHVQFLIDLQSWY